MVWGGADSDMSTLPSTVIPGLGGYTCIRNSHALAYCVELAIESLLTVCEEVVVADSDSTDGTLETLQRMADNESRLKIVRFPWTNPKGVSHHYWVEWLNFARQHLTTKFQITVDGDEIIDSSEACHAAIREACASPNPARRFRRNNYWRSPELLIPPGHCCAHEVVRLGLAEMAMPSDQPVHPGEYPIVDAAKFDARLLVHHVGFLRPAKQFYLKANAVLSMWFNRYDERLADGERDRKNLWETEAGAAYNDKLVKHNDVIPDGVQRILSEWGHNTQHYLAMTQQEAYKRVMVTGEAPKPGEPMNVLHVGDLGDILHSLPILKAIGNVNLYVRDNNTICKKIVHRMPLLEPLLREQCYIKEFTEHTDQPIHWSAGEFRKYHKLTSSLLQAHMLHYQGQKHLPKLNVYPASPSIDIFTPDPTAKGRIVINRTDRYPNRLFRWKDIVRHYGAALMFVGHPDEHQAFCEQFGTVDYRPTENLLEVAQLIAASELFIGNQSACFAVAEGMKHRRLLEVYPQQPDVIVDPPGGSALYSVDGSLDIPAMGRLPALKCGSTITNINYLKNPNQQPKTGWKLDNYHDVSYSCLKRQVMANLRMTDKEAHKAIFDALAEREPSYFDRGSQPIEVRPFEQAIANAKSQV